MKYPKELVGIRGLTATYVLVHHALGSLPPTFIGDLLDNTYGVKLFMIVSGFSIYWLLDTRETSYGRFITGRFFRVFPAYLVALIVYALLLGFIRQTYEAAPEAVLNMRRLEFLQEAQSNFFAHFAVHLTLLQGLVPESVLPHSSSTIVSQAWSLTVEWQLYLVAPFVIFWLSTIDKARSQLCLVGLVAALLWIGRSLSPGFLGNNLEMFSIGLISYRLAKNAASGVSAGAMRSSLVAMLVLAAIWDANALPSVIVWIATIYAVFAFDRNLVVAAISGCLRSRPLLYLGRISYSFYLFHILGLVLSLRAIEIVGLPAGLRFFVLPAAAFVLTLVFSEIAFRVVEQPFHRFGKALARRGAAASSGTPVVEPYPKPVTVGGLAA